MKNLKYQILISIKKTKFKKCNVDVNNLNVVTTFFQIS